MARSADAIVERLARTLSRVFFREVEVQGQERIPRGVPLLLVANHHNSLVDPVLIWGSLGLQPRFLAKATLWNVPGVRRLLDLGGVVPVHRAQDGGDMSRNAETFARCFDALAEGGTVALFPEGISHDAPHLADLKTGAARIVLGAAEERGVHNARIVPIGLTFEAKGQFRSRALVRVGRPIDPEPWIKRYADEPREASRDLTEKVRGGLHAVTLNYPSREEARLLDQAADVFAAQERELPARMALAEAFAVRRDFIAGYERLRESAPEQVQRVADRAERYATSLEREGVRDDHVASRYPGEEVGAFVVGSLSLLLFWLPLAFVGTILNFLPYRLLGIGAGFTKTGDLPATVKLFGGFFLFPLTWLAWAILAGTTMSAAAGLLTFSLGPLTGWYAMRFHERYERFWEEAVPYVRLKLRPERAAALREERDALKREVHAIAELDRPAAAAKDRTSAD